MYDTDVYVELSHFKPEQECHVMKALAMADCISKVMNEEYLEEKHKKIK